MPMIEKMVGVLSGATKGQSAHQILAGLQRYAEATESPLPPWVTERFVEAVQERMRRLVGRWKATPFGGAMELAWD